MRERRSRVEKFMFLRNNLFYLAVAEVARFIDQVTAER